jgi:hypothetical protein
MTMTKTQKLYDLIEKKLILDKEAKKILIDFKDQAQHLTKYKNLDRRYFSKLYNQDNSYITKDLIDLTIGDKITFSFWHNLTSDKIDFNFRLDYSYQEDGKDYRSHKTIRSDITYYFSFFKKDVLEKLEDNNGFLELEAYNPAVLPTLFDQAIKVMTYRIEQKEKELDNLNNTIEKYNDLLDKLEDLKKVKEDIGYNFFSSIAEVGLDVPEIKSWKQYNKLEKL